MTVEESGEHPHLDAAGRATLRTISSLAGVHVSTVSRALASSTPSGIRVASADTVQRIREIASEVGYVRNPIAAGLRSNRTGTIGVLVPRLTDFVLADIYEGIESGAEEAGSLTIVTNTHDSEEERLRRAEMLLARRVDGLILGDARLRDDVLLEYLEKRSVPFVLVSRRSGEYPSVTCDDEMGGRLAADHLLALGHRDVAVIAGEPYASTGIDRLSGFRRQFASADAPVADDHVIHTGFDVTAGHEAMTRALHQFPTLSAVFVVNDFAAIGAMGAAQEAGRTPGQDIAIIGFNDVSVAKDLPITLTTIRSPLRDLGKRAAYELANLLESGHAASVRLAPELKARASTMPYIART